MLGRKGKDGRIRATCIVCQNKSAPFEKGKGVEPLRRSFQKLKDDGWRCVGMTDTHMHMACCPKCIAIAEAASTKEAAKR